MGRVSGTCIKELIAIMEDLNLIDLPLQGGNLTLSDTRESFILSHCYLGVSVVRLMVGGIGTQDWKGVRLIIDMIFLFQVWLNHLFGLILGLMFLNKNLDKCWFRKVYIYIYVFLFLIYLIVKY